MWKNQIFYVIKDPGSLHCCCRGLTVKQTKSNVVVSKPVAALKVSIKPPATKPAVGVLRRMSSLVTSRPSVQNVVVAKPCAPKARLPLKPLPVKKEEEPAKLAEQAKPSIPELEGFSTEQIDKLEKFDAKDKGDPHSVVDYVREIYEYLKQLEVMSCPSSSLARERSRYCPAAPEK